MSDAETTQHPRARGGLVGAAGRRRSMQLAAEAEAERQRVESELSADFGRAPIALEANVIEQISARIVEGRRLRRQGRDDTEQSRSVAQLLRSIGLRPQPAAAVRLDPTAELDAVFNKIAAEGEAS